MAASTRFQRVKDWFLSFELGLNDICFDELSIYEFIMKVKEERRC